MREAATVCRHIPFSVAVALILALTAACDRDDDSAREAPDFALPSLVGGDSLSLERFDGQYVLMNFWASWCGPCIEEVPALVSIQSRFKGKGLSVLGVTVNDHPDDSRGFAHEYGMSYPNVVGNQSLYDAYQLPPGIPVTLLVSPTRRIVKEWFGPQSEEEFLSGIRAHAPELARGIESNKQASSGRASAARLHTRHADAARTHAAAMRAGLK